MILSEKNSCHGYARCRPRGRRGKNIVLVRHNTLSSNQRLNAGAVLNPITNTAPANALALQHSTLHSAYPKRSKHRRVAPASPAHSTHSHSTPKASQPSSPTHDSDEEPEEEPSLRIGLILHRLADGYAARANDPWNYMELNRMVRCHFASEVLGIDQFPGSERYSPSIIRPGIGGPEMQHFS